MSSIRKQQAMAPQSDPNRAVQVAPSSVPTEQLKRQQQQQQQQKQIESSNLKGELKPANETSSPVKSDLTAGRTFTSTEPISEGAKLHATSHESSNVSDTRKTKAGQQQQQRRHQLVQSGASTTGEANNNSLETVSHSQSGQSGARVDDGESSSGPGRGLPSSSQGQSGSQQERNDSESSKLTPSQATDASAADDRAQVHHHQHQHRHHHHQQQQQEPQRRQDDAAEDKEDKLTQATPTATINASTAVIMIDSNKLSNREHHQAANLGSSTSSGNEENRDDNENHNEESRVAGITSTASDNEQSGADKLGRSSSIKSEQEESKATTPTHQAPPLRQANYGIIGADSLIDELVNNDSDQSNVRASNLSSKSCNQSSNSNNNNNLQETISTTIDINNLKPTAETEVNGQRRQQQQQLVKQSHLQFIPAPAPAQTTTSINNNSSCNNCNKNNNSNDDDDDHHHHHHQHKQQEDQLEGLFQGRTKRLGYFQSLLLRKWPCLALTICIMSSLLFSILLSGLTIYLVHDATDCGHLAKFAADAAASGPAALPANSHLHRHYAAGVSASSSANNQLHSNLLPTEFGLDSPPIDQTELAGRHLLATKGADLSAASDQSKPFERLPTAIVPEHYEIFVWPHLVEPDFTFDGSVEIYLRCVEPTDNITLHTHADLKLNESSISLIRLDPAKSSDGKAAPTAPAAAPVAPATATTAPATPLASPKRLGRSAVAAPAAASVAASHQVATGNGHADAELKRKWKPAREQDSVKVSRTSQDKQLQYSIIHLDKKLEAGQDYLLRMDFVGFLNDDLAGFYKMKYMRPNSTEVTWVAATQFEATDARRAFPCFDEPRYKATFSIKIKHLKNMTALSNMPIVKSEDSPDGLWITDTFAKSHRMSTYLVAFTVTDFVSRSEGNISVWTRPGMLHTAEFALKIAGKILRHYEDFFGIEYPLPKMDMIALPDFNAGAMENWGLITYRETAMLYDERTSSVRNKQNVALTVAHEIAHQWFGNLVTPKWWDDLWLNEGFATYVEYIGMDHVAPNWRLLDQFVVDEIQDVLQSDCMSSSHQISIPVRDPEEITEIFDEISYSKGASIIRMLNHFLTDKVFKEGLKLYLNAFRYSNSAQSDLWHYLTEAQRSLQPQPQPPKAEDTNTGSNATTTLQLASAKPEMVSVERVMNLWTLQVGYPLVTLTRSYGTANETLEQIRYQPDKWRTRNDTLDEDSDAGTETWEIPITFTWQSELNWKPDTRLWMHSNQSEPVAIERSLAPVPSDEWMLVNVHQVGYYRVNYDLNNWKMLIDQLQRDHTKIPSTNRAQILDDLFELAQSSLIDIRLAMDATKYLKSEREYLPWRPVLKSLGHIGIMLQRTPIFGDWQDYFAQLIEPYYSRYKDTQWTLPANKTKQQQQQLVEIDSEDVLELKNQISAIASACGVIDHCAKRSKELFSEWRKTGQNNIKPGLRHTIYCMAIRTGTKSEWDFLWKQYEREQDATEKNTILSALSCSKEMWILARYLEWTFDKTKPIRRQDGTTIFTFIAGNNYGREIAFNFMRERWTPIKEYYGKSSFSFGNLIKSVPSYMTTRVELNEFRAFYETIKGDLGTATRSFQQAIEAGESNVLWMERNYKVLETWLQKERSNTQRV